MKITQRFILGLLVLGALASPACKREDEPIPDTKPVLLPGSDNSIIATEDADRAAAIKAEAEKALAESRTRNEELKKELEDLKQQQAQDAIDKPDEPSTASTTFGPYYLNNGNLCLEVPAKNPIDGAPLGVGACSAASHQAFAFNLIDERNSSYTITAQHSQKCLEVEGNSHEIGARLIQSPCDKTQLGEQFYILSLNDSDFLLQNVGSEYCFNLQPSGTLTQAVCDSNSKTWFQMRKVTQ